MQFCSTKIGMTSMLLCVASLVTGAREGEPGAASRGDARAGVRAPQGETAPPVFQGEATRAVFIYPTPWGVYSSFQMHPEGGRVRTYLFLINLFLNI